MDEFKNELPENAPDGDTADERIDEILDFYKDKVLEEEQAAADGAELVNGDAGQSDVSTPSPDDEELHDTQYGLSKRNRMILTYSMTAAVCLIILVGSYGITLLIPTNNERAAEYADQLRNSDSYIKIKTEHAEVLAETKKAESAVEDKKKLSEAAENDENTKAELRKQISEKAAKLKEINSAVTEKTIKSAAIDAEIASKSGTAITLSPGRYTVGSDIAAGRYSIVGNGSFSAATSGGSSKYNKTLGSTPIEVELQAGDKLRLDCSVKFTPLH